MNRWYTTKCTACGTIVKHGIGFKSVPQPNESTGIGCGTCGKVLHTEDLVLDDFVDLATAQSPRR